MQFYRHKHRIDRGGRSTGDIDGKEDAGQQQRLRFSDACRWHADFDCLLYAGDACLVRGGFGEMLQCGYQRGQCERECVDKP